MTHDADRLDKALGLAIRLRRHSAGLSQAELGQAVGVSFQQVQKYERGANRVSFSTLARISKVLDCPIPELAAEALGLAESRPGRGEPLTTPEAAPILEALSKIRAAPRRRAVLALAQELAQELAPAG